MPMNVSYGPPGHKGVTHLVAIGADELEEEATVPTARPVAILGAGVTVLGIISGSRDLRMIGAGVLFGALGSYLLKRRPRTVEITQPR